jgi:hypothetical protein
VAGVVVVLDSSRSRSREVLLARAVKFVRLTIVDLNTERKNAPCARPKGLKLKKNTAKQRKEVLFRAKIKSFSQGIFRFLTEN